MRLTTEETARAARFFAEGIHRLASRPVRLMEVCGTHTVSIFRAGIRQLLPPTVELVSGPGCPVCVTPNEYLDTAIAYSRCSDIIITTFGDMLKVPGSDSSLMAEKAKGADIRIVYSPLESLTIARENPNKKIVFLAVGFETTAPTAAATVLQAEQQGITNFFVLSAHKLVPPALKAILAEPKTKVDGFLLPGHTVTISGLEPYYFVTQEHAIPAVVTGFEALDILQGVYLLLEQISTGKAELVNQYRRVVKPEGNPAARRILDKVYQPDNAVWRGFGVIAGSGLALTAVYQRFDAKAALPLGKVESREPAGCRCGEVLRGLIMPADCPHFGLSCTPEQPVGACMVSVEGACAAWYKYGQGRWSYA
ncbi:hydrogenase formation protein HypD [Sporomusa malonica]|uniref:Hydrogenase maturation protein HypD n=1 Tax=Sporomusa malonica TaxID=112901 RepID=A0A1W1YYZ6_9FIRM|nr:hydrogenase formation protein HypD [Sporomusa malonica]SMC40908.1 Hydrogenase maturation protein HypD [Sporomusa malonica]